MSGVKLPGYTERESEFLSSVRDYSGVFVIRQFWRVAKIKPGSVSNAFTDKLKRRSHARIGSLSGRHVYELTKRFYDECGGVLRRSAQTFAMLRQRLYALDFVVDHDLEYLVSEEEKRSYFSGFAIPERQNFLADRKIPFAERFPIYLLDGGGAGFVFPDASSQTQFREFVRRYRAFMRSIIRAEVIFVTESSERGEAAEQVFAKEMRPNNSLLMEKVFQERSLLEKQLQTGTLTQAEMMRLRVLRASKGSECFDSWRADPASLHDVLPTGDVTFRVARVATDLRYLCTERPTERFVERKHPDSFLRPRPSGPSVPQ